MSFIIQPDDLTAFAPNLSAEKAAQMIEDVESMALLVAPCLADPSFPSVGAARAILRGALLRWHESGSGAIRSRTMGPYGETIDTTQERRGMFWPSEITQLQGLCSGGGRRVVQAWAL